MTGKFCGYRLAEYPGSLGDLRRLQFRAIATFGRAQKQSEKRTKSVPVSKQPLGQIARPDTDTRQSGAKFLTIHAGFTHQGVEFAPQSVIWQLRGLGNWKNQGLASQCRFWQQRD